MYKFTSMVRYSETDLQLKLTLEDLMNYFQDCSTFQSEVVGEGIEACKARNIVWVVNFWQIIIKRRPKLGEHIVIGTNPYEFRSCFGFRNFMMQTEGGEMLAMASSVWSLISLDGHPVRVPQEMMEHFGCEEKLDMDYAPRKIQIPAKGDWVEYNKIRITEHHLDANMHVNNVQYVRIATDCVGEHAEVTEVRAEYRKPAFLGDAICPKMLRQDDMCIVVLADESGVIYSIIQLFTEK